MALAQSINRYGILNKALRDSIDRDCNRSGTLEESETLYKEALDLFDTSQKDN